MESEKKTPAEPRNPLYFLLLVVGVLFCVTALAYAVVPVMEERAHEHDLGEETVPSPFRDALKADGWKWLLMEVAALIFLGLASMMLDHANSAKSAAETPPSDTKPSDLPPETKP